MMDATRFNRRLDWIFAAALANFAAAVAVLFPHHAPDTARFLAEAKNLAAAGIFSLDGVTATARDFPLLPAILALFIKLGLTDPEPAARILNGLCTGVTALGVARGISLLLERDRPGAPEPGPLWPRLGMLAAGLHPALLGSATFVLTEPLYTALFLWANLFLLRAWREPEHARAGLRWLIGGLLLGLACLTRAVPLLYLPCWLGVAWLLRRPDPRAVKRAAAALGVMLLLVLPWTLRNLHATGRFVPVAFGTGTYLYVGASQEWQAAWPDFDPAERLAGETGVSILEADARLGRQAVAAIAADPGGWMKLNLLKLKRFFLEVPGSKKQIASALAVRLLLAANLAGLLLAAAGVWVCRRSPAAWLLLLPVAYTALLHTALYSMGRFRVPVEPYILLFAVAAGQAAVAAWPRRRSTE